MSDEKESNLKAITLTPVLSEIFRPTAILLGKELKEYTETKINRIKLARQGDNISQHIASVEKIIHRKASKLQEEKPIPVAAMNQFTEMLDLVQDVDPADHELSTLWQHIMADIAAGKALQPSLLGLLKDITPMEAKHLFAIRQRNSISRIANPFYFARELVYGDDCVSDSREADKFYIRILRQKGLSQKTYIVEMLLSLLLVSLSYLAWVANFGSTKLGIFGSHEDITIMMQPMMITMMIFMFICMLIMKSNFPWCGRDKLTWIARELLQHVPSDGKHREDLGEQLNAKEKPGEV